MRSAFLNRKVLHSIFRIFGAVGLILIVGIFTTFLLDGSEEAEQRSLYEQEKPLWEKMDALREKSETDPVSRQELMRIMPPENEFKAMIERRAEFEAEAIADNIAIENLIAKTRDSPPSFWIRMLQVIDAPVRLVSLGTLSLDSRSKIEIEAEQRAHPKKPSQETAELLSTIVALTGLTYGGHKLFIKVSRS